MRFDSAASSLRLAILIFAIAPLVFAANARAQTYDLRVLHRFSGEPNDGADAYTAVQFDAAGNLYGTTDSGGAFNGGTVYKIANDGTRTESILHSFDAVGPQGSILPNGMAIDSSTGDIYGTTAFGGDMSCGEECTWGGGQIYKISADGTFTVVHAFNPEREGSEPWGVIRDPQGNLYGFLQGPNEQGPYKRHLPILFEYSADGAFSVLHAFKYKDGFFPATDVIRDGVGNLYFGVLNAGGNFCGGAIYKLTPDGALTPLYSFTGGAEGCYPTSLTGDQSGNLYGSADYYGVTAVVFKLAPDGTFTILHTFHSDVGAGVFMSDVLPAHGSLYGTAQWYGDSHSPALTGLLYTIAPDGTYTKLYDFPVSDQVIQMVADPYLTLKYGRLYGVTNAFYENKTGDTAYTSTLYSVGVATQ